MLLLLDQDVDLLVINRQQNDDRFPTKKILISISQSHTEFINLAVSFRFFLNGHLQNYQKVLICLTFLLWIHFQLFSIWYFWELQTHSKIWLVLQFFIFSTGCLFSHDGQQYTSVYTGSASFKELEYEGFDRIYWEYISVVS